MKFFIELVRSICNELIKILEYAMKARLSHLASVRNLGFAGSVVVAALMALPATAPIAFGAVYTWDNGTQSPTGPTDGGGTWSSTIGGFWNGSGYQPWNNATFDTAQFGFSSGNTNQLGVTLDTSGVTAGGVVFQDQAYTISGSTLTLGGSTPTITTNAANGAISSLITGSSGLTTSGSGMLTLGSLNTYTGGTTISAGTLVTGAAGLGTGSVNVAPNGTLWVNGGTNFGQSTTGLSAVYSFMLSGVTGGVNAGNGTGNTWQTGFSLASQLAGVQALYSPQSLTLSTTAAALNYTGTTFPSPFGTNNKTFFDSYYSGMINIATSGTYTFGNNNSDDDVAVSIDGQQVLRGTPNGTNAWQGGYRQGSVTLAAGMHNIVVTYYQGFGGYAMDATVSGPSISGTVDIGSAGAPQVTPDLVVGSLSGSGNVVLSTGNLSTGFDNTNTTFSGAISDIGGVNKWGTGTLTLAGSNTYTGMTAIVAGRLNLASTAALTSGNFSMSGGTLQPPAGLASMANNFALAGNDIFVNSSPLTLSGSISMSGGTISAAAPLNLSGNVTLGSALNNFTTTGNTITVSGAIGNAAAVGDAIVVSGSGNLVLAGSLNVAGTSNNSGNTPALIMGGAGNGGGNANGATTTITGGGTLSNISTAWNGTANVLNLAPAFPLFLTANGAAGAGDALAVAQGGGNGVVNQTGGTVNVLGSVSLGKWDGSYGAYNMSGGSLSAVYLLNGGAGNDSGSSFFYQTGGAVTISASTVLGFSSGNGPGPNTAMNVLHVANGSFNETVGNITLGNAAGQTGVVTVSGGSLAVSSGTIVAGNNATGTGIVNLNGGLLQANAIKLGAGTGIVNFNGGDLQASGNASAAFLSGLTSANVYSSGGTIDNNGKSITIAQALLAASGSGVSSIPVTAGGTNFIGAPVVKITGGGGSGATAEAMISSGSLSAIVITNPGTGYTSAPSITISGGTRAGGTAPTLGTSTLAANSGAGAMTFVGSGVTTLTSSASSLGGNLVVSGGTLQAATSNNANNPTTTVLGNAQLPSRSIIVNNGAVLQFTAANVLGSAAVQSNSVFTPLVINAGGTVTNSTGVNNILGPVVLSGGTLTGGAGSNGTLYSWQLSGGSVNVNTAPSVMTGAGANTGFNMAQNTTFNVAATGGASPDLTVSAPLGDVQFGLASASLLKTGNGLMQLSAANTYTGNTTVNGGTLALAGASTNNISTSPAISLGAAGTLDVTALSGGSLALGAAQTLSGFGTVNGGVTSGGTASQIVPGSLTKIGTLATGNLDLSAGGNLTFVLGSPGLGSLINVTGNVTLPSTQIASLNLLNNNNANGQGSISSGSYDLINYTGSLFGSPLTAFGAGSGAKIYSFSTVAGSPNELVANVTIFSFAWTGLTGGMGAADSNWTTAATSTNWANTTSGNAPTQYFDQAIVTFGDINPVTGLAISTTAVNLATNVAPTSITFSNSAVNYVLSGSGGITGPTGIVLNGTGAVTLGTSNNFTSPVQINAGSLTITNAAALGNAPQAVVASGGALQIQGGIFANAVPLTLNGTGLAASPAGALVGVGGVNSYAGAVTLASPATIGASGGTLALSGGVANGGNLLTTAGAGTLIVSTLPISGSGGLTASGPGNLVLSASNSYSGATTVNGGTLTIGTPNALPFGAFASNVTVNGAATLNLGGNAVNINGLFGSGTIDNTVPGLATLIVGNNNASGSFTGVIQNTHGSLAFDFAGNGTLYLTNTANAYSGGTTINGGVLNIAGDGALGSSAGGVVFTGNSTLQFAAPTTLNPSRGLQIGSGVSATIDTQGNLVTIQGAIGGNGNLVVPGNDQLVLSSVFSSLGGAITQSGNSSLTIAGLMTLGGALNESGTSNLMIPGTLTVGGALTQTGSSNLSVAGNLAVAGNLTQSGIGNTTISGTLGVAGAAAEAGNVSISGSVTTGAYSQTGIGSLAITGTGSLSALTATIGTTAGDNELVTISGSGALTTSATGAGSIVLSNAASATTIVNMTGGAVTSAGQLWIGNNGTGVVNLSGGTVTSNDWLSVGRTVATAGFGALNLSGSGTIVHSTTNNVELSGNGGNGTSIVQQTGNSTFQNSFGTVQIGSSGWGLYTASSGTANFGSTSLGSVAATGIGILTVSGSAIVNAGGLTLGGLANGSGLVNLNGGVLSATGIAAGGSGTNSFTFNGGTLVAAPSAQTSFANGLASMNVGPGGAIINTNGQNIAIVSSLVAPAGNGVQSISAGGSGYISAPAVKISGGGGSGATAEALIDGSGNLTGITITNPGTGYTSAPTVSIVGANGTLSTSAAATLNSGNASGGLTVNGGGMLTLTGTSNYTGATTVSSGTLQLGLVGLTHRWSFTNDYSDSVGGVAAIPFGNATLAGSGVTFNGGGSVGANYVSLGSGTSNLLPTSNSPFTVQVWATQNNIQAWSRLFDFGSTAGGNSNLLWSWTQGTNPPGVVAANSVNYPNPVNFSVGTEYNVTLVVTPSGGGSILQWYQMDTAGDLLGSGSVATTWNISKLAQLNMWLGRSEYGDQDADATYDEVRLYNVALSQSQLLAMNLAGPDAPVAPSFYPVLPTATPVTLAANGTLDLNGVSQQIASLNDATPGSGGTVINSNTSTTTVLTLSPTGSATFSGSIVGGTLGTISLVMNGPGTQVLSGTNTYLGGTTVENGTLVVANNEAIEDGTNLTVGDPSAFMAPPVPQAVRPRLPLQSLPCRNRARWACSPRSLPPPRSVFAGGSALDSRRGCEGRAMPACRAWTLE